MESYPNKEGQKGYRQILQEENKIGGGWGKMVGVRGEDVQNVKLRTKHRKRSKRR